MWHGINNKIVYSNFTNNQAYTGGGLSYRNQTNLYLINTNFQNNSAKSHGGAIEQNVEESDITIIDSLFINNTSPLGSAITVRDLLTLKNSYFKITKQIPVTFLVKASII